jgi:ABC-type transport system substrate-binding protein
MRLWLLGLLFAIAMPAQATWNNPYPRGWVHENTLFSAFSAPPKTLDPVKSYSSNEWVFLGNIVEPPLQYHYLKRPYVLEPLILTAMPQVTYIQAEDVSEYTLHLRDDIAYAPNAAFNGKKRFVTAADLAYAIARMSDRRNGSPILDIMLPLIVGMDEQVKTVSALPKSDPWRDYRGLQPSGVQVIDEHTLTIRLHGVYPPFMYWLAMPFFAPIPWEVDQHYAQAGMKANNQSWDWQPVGSGAYYLSENNPNQRMVLQRNPNFHSDSYPSEASAEIPKTLLADAGKKLPFIDRIVFALEKESVPYWAKFLQGYYDASGVSSEVFDQAIVLDSQGQLNLTPSMREKGMHLLANVATSSSYMGFNMRDPIIGQSNPKARWLRQAISIAVDYEEDVAIFQNGRGVVAQGPIPPGIAGASTDCNPVTHHEQMGKCVRRPLSDAKALMIKAGYPDGIDPTTGKGLVLYYDTVSTGADDKAQLDWMRKQFAKLGIQLVIRSSDYNRFQEKMMAGNAQIFTWGWNADYPDAENFLFLLYGPNAKADKGGENASNYANPTVDGLYQRISRIEDSPERRALIAQAVAILREDAPWIWGFHPQNVSLFHGWVGNVYPNLMANNTLKYRKLEIATRKQAQLAWNQPVLWPFGVLLLLLTSIGIAIWRKKKELG